MHTPAGKSSNWQYTGWTVLAVAIVLAYLIVCGFLVSRLHSRYPKYDALMDAINHGDVAAVKAELDKGTDPNIYPTDDAALRDETDIAPLDSAVQDGNLEIVKVLLAHHADPNMGDGWNYCPLAAAAEESNIEMMKLLISNGAKINDDVVGTGSSALWRAAMDGKTESVAFLLAHGASPNSSANDETLLHALKGMQPKAEIVALLKKAGGKE